MRLSSRRMTAVVIAAGLGLTGCGRLSKVADGGHREAKPAIVDRVDGSEVKRVTLSQQASNRLGITTVPVGEVRFTPALVKKVVPYTAVIYDTKGVSWVYTMPQPLTFIRQRVVVEKVTGNDATLSDGPPPGTLVVTKGVAELYGAELGVGK
jgi:hypothetical protein